MKSLPVGFEATLLNNGVDMFVEVKAPSGIIICGLVGAVAMAAPLTSSGAPSLGFMEVFANANGADGPPMPFKPPRTI